MNTLLPAKDAKVASFHADAKTVQKPQRDTEIVTHSRGLISTWTFLPEHGVMFDCGDGASSHLGNQVETVMHLAITHEHLDHISGLAAFLSLRHRLKPQSQITLYLPGRSPRFEAMLSVLGHNALSMVNVIHVEEGRRYDIGGKRVLVPVKTRHTQNSFGYLIQEKRSYLKAEYQGLVGQELAALKKAGVNIQDERPHTLVAYTGDTPALNEAEITAFSNADTLIIESTFLAEEADISTTESMKHSLLADALRASVKAAAKRTLLNHVSPRYRDGEVINTLRGCFTKNLSVVLGHEIIRIAPLNGGQR